MQQNQIIATATKNVSATTFSMIFMWPIVKTFSATKWNMMIVFEVRLFTLIWRKLTITTVENMDDKIRLPKVS